MSRAHSLWSDTPWAEARRIIRIGLSLRKASHRTVAQAYNGNRTCKHSGKAMFPHIHKHDTLTISEHVWLSYLIRVSVVAYPNQLRFLFVCPSWFRSYILVARIHSDVDFRYPSYLRLFVVFCLLSISYFYFTFDRYYIAMRPTSTQTPMFFPSSKKTRTEQLEEWSIAETGVRKPAQK